MRRDDSGPRSQASLSSPDEGFRRDTLPWMPHGFETGRRKFVSRLARPAIFDTFRHSLKRKRWMCCFASRRNWRTACGRPSWADGRCKSNRIWQRLFNELWRQMEHSCWTSQVHHMGYAGHVEVHNRYFKDLLLRLLAQKNAQRQEQCGWRVSCRRGSRKLVDPKDPCDILEGLPL